MRYSTGSMSRCYCIPRRSLVVILLLNIISHPSIICVFSENGLGDKTNPQPRQVLPLPDIGKQNLSGAPRLTFVYSYRSEAQHEIFLGYAADRLTTALDTLPKISRAAYQPVKIFSRAAYQPVKIFISLCIESTVSYFYSYRSEAQHEIFLGYAADRLE